MSIKNLHDLLHNAAKRWPTRPALRQKIRGQWQTWTWSDYYQKAATTGKGLISLGFNKGDRVAILSYTRREWVVCDQAIFSLGGVSVPIYQSNTPEEIEYILNNSEARFLFVEDGRQLDKIRKIKDRLSHLQRVMVFDPPDSVAEDYVMSLEALWERGDREDDALWEQAVDKVAKEDLATLVYTSGTTGPPKGVMLVHGNLLFAVNAVGGALPVTPDDVTLLFLPLAHIFARALEVHSIERGYAIVFAESIEKAAENLPEVRPTYLASVPRIFEKIYAKIQNTFEQQGGLKLKLFQWSLEVGRQVSRLRQQGREPTGWLGIQGKLADRLVYSKVKEKVFGGRIKFFISGGAPLSKEIAEFFHAMGMLILEGYGLTETCAASTLNRPERYRFGSVGTPLPGVEAKLAPDGEILLRGGHIMQGYYKNKAATAEVLDDERWFSTGDIGTIQDGFLTITDRKKDLIITAGGKNIAPQNLENLIKTDSYISQVMVYGDRKPYLVALLTMDLDTLRPWAAERGLPADPARLAEHPEVRKLFEERMALYNGRLAGYEQIKRFRILPNEFGQETGELTPTLKVKRKFCSEKYKKEIEALYA